MNKYHFLHALVIDAFPPSRAQKADDFAKNFALVRRRRFSSGLHTFLCCIFGLAKFSGLCFSADASFKVDVIQARLHSAATLHSTHSHLPAAAAAATAPPLHITQSHLSVATAPPVSPNSTPCAPQPPPIPQQPIQLPLGWTQEHDPQSGRPYYVDHVSRQSSWSPPAAPAPWAPPVAPATVAKFGWGEDGSSTFGASASAGAGAGESLPEGWRQEYDHSGNIFYANDRLLVHQVLPSVSPTQPQRRPSSTAVSNSCSQYERPRAGRLSPPRPAAQSRAAAESSRRPSVAEQQETARAAFRMFDKDR
jgi:hypothetical protein